MAKKQKNIKKSTPVNHKSIKQFKVSKILSMIATLGPIGYFPKGSGTLGSLVALPIAYFASTVGLSFLWSITLFIFVLGLIAVRQFTSDKSEKDPSCVIIDEVAGQLATFVTIMPDLMHWPMLFLGFVLFRFFDIFKFGLVAFWDRRKKPLGVMMDDITAGIFAGFILSIIQFFLLSDIFN